MTDTDKPTAFNGTAEEADGRGKPSTKSAPIAPEFAEVDKLEQRLGQLVARRDGLTGQLASLDNQIRVALVTASTDSEDVVQAKALRREVKSDLDDVIAAIAMLQNQLPGGREKAGRAAAEARLTAITRAYHAVRQEYAQEDPKRLQEAARVYADVVVRLVNGHHHQLLAFEREANALADRFGIPALKLAFVEVPERLPSVQRVVEMLRNLGFSDTSYSPPEVEEDKHKMRRRRTYEEIKGTPAWDIIQAAGGPRPFPPLTPRQEQIVAEREQEARREGVSASLVNLEAEAMRSLSRGGNL